MEASSDLAEARYKTSIVRAKAEEGAHLVNGGNRRGVDLLDGSDLFRVHLEACAADNMTEIFGRGSEEYAFAGFHRDVQLPAPTTPDRRTQSGTVHFRLLESDLCELASQRFLESTIRLV